MWRAVHIHILVKKYTKQVLCEKYDCSSGSSSTERFCRQFSTAQCREHVIKIQAKCSPTLVTGGVGTCAAPMGALECFSSRRARDDCNDVWVRLNCCNDVWVRLQQCVGETESTLFGALVLTTNQIWG